MWTRAELKFRAKENLRRYFWPALAVSMVCALFNSDGNRVSTGANAGMDASQNYDISIWESGSADSIISEIQRAAGEIAESINPVMVSVLLTGIVIGAVIGLALGIFVAPIIEVGKNRFYMESRLTGISAGMGCLLWGFKNHYLNIIWTMFLRNLIVVVSTFCCVIPGIYFAYCYHMVPYILAENPDMKASEVLRMSSDMMRGNKWNTWLLEVSFFGWWILGAMACGIGTIFVYPYYDATFAELYAVLREGFTGYLNGYGPETMGSGYGNGYYGDNYGGYSYGPDGNNGGYYETGSYDQNGGWQQTYEQPNQESNTAFDRGNDVKRSEGGPGRGYYLNGVFYPYTEDELNQLDQNGR